MDDTELERTTFPEPAWAVRGLVPVGGTLVAAKPKDGKSWLCLAFAVAVADGTLALGVYPTVQGDVLYLALEDNYRRMQRRVRAISPQRKQNGRLTVEPTWALGLDGGYSAIDKWLKDHPDCRLVVVDNMRRFDPFNGGYTRESETAQRFNDFALKHNVAMVGVMHMYKGPAISATSPDWADKIQGGVGVTGAVECVMGIARPRSGNTGVLRITGKDIEDDSPVPMLFDKGRWIAGAGEAVTAGMTEERQAVYDTVAANIGLQAKAIAAKMGQPYNNVRHILWNCVQDGILVRPDTGEHKGRYYTPAQFEQLGNPQESMLTPAGNLVPSVAAYTAVPPATAETE